MSTSHDRLVLSHLASSVKTIDYFCSLCTRCWRARISMFGVASNFRKTHGEAAFRILAQTAFDGADTDKSGKIDTAELRTTLEKLGMQLTEAQAAEVVRQYDDDGNHELDQEEFLHLVSELIDGSARLPMAAKKQSSKLEARGVVMSMDDLDFDDDEPPPVAKPIQSSSTHSTSSAEVTALKKENTQLRNDNARLTARVKELEAKLGSSSKAGTPQSSSARRR